jgi:5-methylcytosine-specific restriction endonuclease McrA
MAKEWAKALYHSRAWQPIRKQAMIRDGFTCRICGARATEVDHIKELTPDNISDRNISLNINNLQALCHNCHTKKTMEDKGKKISDCDDSFYFDADGQLSPRVPS